MNEEEQNTTAFTSYQKFVVLLLVITQFTVILDFMVMSPLGDLMMKSMGITTSQFGIAVSAYAFCAGISGLVTAGIADRYDRKKLLIFFYVGFALGTLFCALAPNYPLMVVARIVTGIFGGVIGSISMAIVADLFSIQQRGKVMGFVQMGFGASQVLVIPIGLFIANSWGWHMPFLWIAAMAGIIAVILLIKLKPITEHLSLQSDRSVIMHFWHTLTQSNYRLGFLSTALLSIGGFMLMPFGSAFSINNLKITEAELPILFMITGVGTLITMPLIGRLSDQVNKFTIFLVATIFAAILINIYANYSVTPFWIVLVTNVFLMASVMSRMVPAMALTSALPQPQDRGAFMSINSSLQQISGGFGAVIAGLIIVQKDKYAPLEHYNILALIASLTMIVTIFLVYRVSKIVETKRAKV